jgi:predicted nucleic acid-binding protein
LTVYADSSFFVSLYVQDGHSAHARGLLNLKPEVWLTPLHLAEFFHAIAQQVFFGKMSMADADGVHEDLRRDRAAGLWFETPLPDHALEACADLARRYGPKLGMRTLDTLHVACALELKAERFWTFDQRQANLAKVQGLKIS